MRINKKVIDIGYDNALFKSALIQNYINSLLKVKKEVLTYSKEKRALLLITFIVIPFGLLWVILIIKAKKYLIKNGKVKK